MHRAETDLGKEIYNQREREEENREKEHLVGNMVLSGQLLVFS